MKLFISAALIAGSVSAASADKDNKFHEILGEGEIIDKTQIRPESIYYIVFFDDVLYGCYWGFQTFNGDCRPLKSGRNQ